MGMFSTILAKLGFGADKVEAAIPTATAAAAPAQEAAAPAVQAISEVDVVTKLAALASAQAEKLNWKVSIVDLMKLLGLDSSLAARKELAKELGCPGGQDGGVGADEYVAAQDRAAKAGTERRQHPGRAALSSAQGAAL